MTPSPGVLPIHGSWMTHPVSSVTKTTLTKRSLGDLCSCNQRLQSFTLCPWTWNLLTQKDSRWTPLPLTGEIHSKEHLPTWQKRLKRGLQELGQRSHGQLVPELKGDEWAPAGSQQVSALTAALCTWQPGTHACPVSPATERATVSPLHKNLLSGPYQGTSQLSIK